MPEVSLRPIHLALFFCNETLSRSIQNGGTVDGGFVLWSMQRTAMFHLLPLEKQQSTDFSLTRAANEDTCFPPSSPLFMGTVSRPEEVHAGTNYIFEFLHQSNKWGKEPLFSHFRMLLVQLFRSVIDRDRDAVSLYVLNDVLLTPQRMDLESVKASNNVFSRFRAWMLHSWHCVSFDTQMTLAASLQVWLQSISSIKSSDDLPSIIRKGKTLRKSLNVRDLHSSLQNVFEGRTSFDRVFSAYFLNSQNFMPADNFSPASVLDIFNENIPGTTSLSPNVSGPQSVMMNIACGMLLYQKKYIQLHSLENALTCAEGAVLIEHQFYTNTVIALSYLSAFDVHLASSEASKAADSVAMGLQLLRQKKENISGYIFSLFYFSAARLLLFFPGAVRSSLRSLLLLSGGSSVNNEEERSGKNNDTTVKRPEGLPSQNISQTIIRALLLSESQSLYNAVPECLGKELILYLLRSTLLIEGSIYGISSSPLSLHAITIRELVKQSSADSLPQSGGELELDMLLQLTRHAAHTALAAQEGTLQIHKHPLRVLCDYLNGVLDVYGYSTLKSVESDFFLRGVTHHLIAFAYYQQGYIAASYDILEDLVAEIYFHSRVDLFENDRSKSAMRGKDIDVAAYRYIKENPKLYYWPPDILLLYAYVQMKRAEMASYLGYTSDLVSQSQSLNLICAESKFVFGVLAAQYISILYHQHSHHYHLVVELSIALEYSARRIGLLPFVHRVASQRISAYMKIGSHRRSLAALDSLQPVPPNKLLWYITARLNTITEILIKSEPIAASRKVLKRVFTDALQLVDAHFLRNANEEDIVAHIGISSWFDCLNEFVCLHSSILRLHKMLYPEAGDSTARVCPGALLLRLRKRHLQRRLFSGSPHLLDALLEILNEPFGSKDC